MLDNSTCLLTTPEVKESSNFTFSNDKRNSQDWGRSFPRQFCSKMAAFTNQIECPLHKLEVLMTHLSQVKIPPRKCRFNSFVFHSFYYCALGVTELLTWEEKWKERGGRKGLDVYFIGVWLSPFTDRWFLLRSLRCVLSDNPFSMGKHKQKVMQGTRIWEWHGSCKLSKQLTTHLRWDTVDPWRYTSSWLSCERAKQKDVSLLTLTRQGLLFQTQDSPRTDKFWLHGYAP